MPVCKNSHFHSYKHITKISRVRPRTIPKFGKYDIFYQIYGALLKGFDTILYKLNYISLKLLKYYIRTLKKLITPAS